MREIAGFYTDDHAQHELQAEAYKVFVDSNAIYHDIFPALQKFEAEICSMAADLLNGGVPTVCASFTSGGTESILCAFRSCRERYRDVKPHITEPEVYVSSGIQSGLDIDLEV